MARIIMAVVTLVLLSVSFPSLVSADPNTTQKRLVYDR